MECGIDIDSLQSVNRRIIFMTKKLGIGDCFPRMMLNLVDGSTLELPDSMDAKYRVILFYRGHW